VLFLSNNTTAIADHRGASDRDEDSWTLVPVVDRPGSFVAVFADGSWAEYTPDAGIVC
jgi:hypothetical protein